MECSSVTEGEPSKNSKVINGGIPMDVGHVTLLPVVLAVDLALVSSGC